MTDKTKDVVLLPERWHVLSGSWLKVIAMVSMLIDHIASVILRYDPVFTEPLITLGHQSITWCYLLRFIGRLAFPIFCFLLVELRKLASLLRCEVTVDGLHHEEAQVVHNVFAQRRDVR